MYYPVVLLGKKFFVKNERNYKFFHKNCHCPKDEDNSTKLKVEETLELETATFDYTGKFSCCD